MIIAKALHYMTSEEASKLNWKRITHDFMEASIDALIDMQNNRQDKQSVCDMILSAMKNDTQKHIHEAEIESKLLLIRKMIENGVYSPYREIERLTKDMNVELVLRRIYSGTNKFADHFKWLEDYIAEIVSSKEILKAIAELNETLKKGTNKIIINGDIVEGDKVDEKNVIPHVSNFKPEIQTQTMNVPLPPIEQLEQNLLEDE